MVKASDVKQFAIDVFRGAVINVNPPRAYMVNERLDSYVVEVVYKYSGSKEYIFCVDYDEDIDENFATYSKQDQDRLRHMAQQDTLKNAKEFYSRMQKQIRDNRIERYKQHDMYDCLLTPFEVPSFSPVYDDRGRVSGYSVVVESYAGKQFAYVSKERLKDAGRLEAENWVAEMQQAGYKLLSKPKYVENLSANSISVYVLCQRSHLFPKRPFVDFRGQAWRFYQKVQSMCAKIHKSTRIKINEMRR